MSSAGLRTKNDYAGENRQQFTRPTAIAKNIQHAKVHRTHVETLNGLHLSSAVYLLLMGFGLLLCSCTADLLLMPVDSPLFRNLH